MRKSSLEQKHGRVPRPSRLSNALAEKTTKVGAGTTAKKSGIPMLRTSSADREPRQTLHVTNDVEQRYNTARTTSSRKSRSHSAESNRDQLETPQFRIRPSPGVCSGSRGQPTPMGSVHRGKSTSGSSVKKVLRKDSRPIQDKAFITQEMAVVFDYFTRNSDSLGLLPVELHLRPPTLKLFVQMSSALLGKLFPKQVLNMSNYTEEIPALMRLIKYPGNLNRSWLVAANTPHAIPHVIGMLSWLLCLLSNATIPPEFIEDKNDLNLPKIMVQIIAEYLADGYRMFDREGVEDFDEIDAHLKNNLEKVSGKDVRYRQTLQEEMDELEFQLNDPKELALIDKVKILEEESRQLKLQVNTSEEEITKKMNDRDKAKQSLEITKQQVLELSERLAKRIADLKELQTTVSQQQMTVEDKAQMLSQLRECQANNLTLEKHCEENNKTIYTSDMQIARVRGKINEQCLQFNNLLRESTSELLPLDDLHLEVADIHRVSKERFRYVDQRLDVLEADINTRLNQRKTQLMETKLGEQKMIEQATKDQEELLRWESDNAALEREMKEMKRSLQARELSLMEQKQAIQEKIKQVIKEKPDLQITRAEAAELEKSIISCKADLEKGKQECHDFMARLFEDNEKFRIETMQMITDEVSRLL